MRIERQLHHYGSALNALPLLSEFRSRAAGKTSPTKDAAYLLRVGYGGISGPLTNIDREGFGSASFHSFPDSLHWDGYSGDYGPGFVGLALGAGTYIAGEDTEFGAGQLVFGGQVAASTAESNTSLGSITIVPRDPVRRRVYLAPMGLQLEIDAGVIQRIIWNSAAGEVRLVLDQLSGGPVAKSALLWTENEASTGRSSSSNYIVSVQNGDSIAQSRGGWVIPLGTDSASSTTVSVTQRK